MKAVSAYMLILLLPLFSRGQDQVGIKAGYICYWFDRPDQEMYSCHYDFSHSACSVSLMLKQRADNTFIPGIELAYTNRSFTVRSGCGNSDQSQYWDYSYNLGNVYLKVQPRFITGDRVRFFFYPGFYIGALLHSSLHGTHSIWNGSVLAKTETKNGNARGYYPDVEFGAIVGAGIDIPLNRHLSLVYENSFTMSMTPVAKAWGVETARMFGLNFELGIAYNFKMKKPGSIDKIKPTSKEPPASL